MIGTEAAETTGRRTEEMTGRRTEEMTGGEEEAQIEMTVIGTETRIEIEITEEIEIEDEYHMEKMSEEQGFLLKIELCQSNSFLFSFKHTTLMC